MDRTSRITGRAVGLALAAALSALSCRASSPAAVTEISPEARADAAPNAEASAGPTAKAGEATATVDVKAKGEPIVLPKVWISARSAPQAAWRSAGTMPSPAVEPSALSRLYGSDSEHFALYGLGLSTPEKEAQPPALLSDPAMAPGRLASPAPRLVAHAPPPLLMRFDGDAKLPEPAVGDVLRAHLGAFDACYATAAHVTPGSLYGRADVHFLVREDGRVGWVETHARGLAGSPVPKCVSNVVSRLSFAPPAAPVEVNVHFEKRASGA